MIVLIHGGPSSAAMPEWPASFGMSRAFIAGLTLQGYYVLLPNPRGSYGQGEDLRAPTSKISAAAIYATSSAGSMPPLAKDPIDPRASA